ncbi:MAG: phosphoribosylformylglycinamidine synthase subunit PurQ [Chthoniobacterales bacterium]|nr:phosphoribosylformylglycinamidine synthase subunit PurQ [Chthoniobacterales bacterium]
MKFAVLRFPGSNCDQDCLRTLRDNFGQAADPVWHKETSVTGYDVIIIPGGFSYGDYLRCGAFARYSPVMAAVREAAGRGTPVLGICNGFQILCEAGMLPGALVRNRGLHFICRHVHLRLGLTASPFTSSGTVGQVLRIPIAHGEGCYFAAPDTLDQLEGDGRIAFRYCTPDGEVSAEANPNGSLANIAGILNKRGNVLGLMPHPERACEQRLGSTDGRLVFDSIIQSALSAVK